jgi:hypothetical protein
LFLSVVAVARQPTLFLGRLHLAARAPVLRCTREVRLLLRHLVVPERLGKDTRVVRTSVARVPRIDILLQVVVVVPVVPVATPLLVRLTARALVVPLVSVPRVTSLERAPIMPVVARAQV